MKKTVYICESCGKIMDNPTLTLKAMQYHYALDLEIPRKIHLCYSCLNGLKNIGERIIKNENHSK